VPKPFRRSITGYIDSRGVMVGVYYGSNFASRSGIGRPQWDMSILLSHPKGVNGTQLRAINASDVIVGWYLDAGNMPHAFSTPAVHLKICAFRRQYLRTPKGINVGGEISGQPRWLTIRR